VINTGKFTGRSPKDKFTVKDAITAHTVHWNEFNIAIEEKYFLGLKEKMLAYLKDKEIWVRDCYACADDTYRLSLRVINENPWSNLFCYNMFIRPKEEALDNFTPHWHMVPVPKILPF
jgi:phosphoenolpyruvate carboxykinase (ATP)